MGKRDSGFYWVTMDGDRIVARWDKGEDWWWVCGDDRPFCDRDFDEIGPRITEGKHNGETESQGL